MTFYKVASVESLGTAVTDDNGFLGTNLSKKASSEDKKSYYIDGSRKLDIGALLKEAAPKYNISANPSDYIYEAIRANTVNVPNENHDAFHKDELLRFDTKLAKPVYMTYTGKPHHLNHNASDPKRARGVILDAHYNSDSPALENCDVCGHKTAEEVGRDPSGVHCSNCGSVAKDEFVEILVAVDTTKDKALAQGIKDGILNAGSMGCSCSSTVCNVCDHVAKTVSDFCPHIRGASKGSLWIREGNSFTKSDKVSVRNMLRKANLKLPTEHNFISGRLKVPELNFEVRKAFEFCQGVEFDEYSRVHKPADPKALTVELLKAASVQDAALTLEQETEQLIRKAHSNEMRARLNQLGLDTSEKPMSKSSSKITQKTFYAVRVNGINDDLHISASLKDAIKSAELGKRDNAEYFTVSASSLQKATVIAAQNAISKSAQYIPVTSDVTMTIPDGVNVHIDEHGNMVDENGNPVHDTSNSNSDVSENPGAQDSESIEDLTKKETHPENEDGGQTPEEFGMLPPGASAPEEFEDFEMNAQEDEDMNEDADMDSEDSNMDSSEDSNMNMEAELDTDSQFKFAQVYNDFEIEVFSDSAILRSPGGDVLSIKASKELETSNDMQNFGEQVISTLLTDGLVRTAKKFEGKLHNRIAANDGSLEGVMTSMKDGFPATPKDSLEGLEQNFKWSDGLKSTKSKNPVDSGASIHDAEFNFKHDMKVPVNTLESERTNYPFSDDDHDPSENSTEGLIETLKDGREKYKENSDSTEGLTTSMKSAASDKTAERVRKLYANRLAQAKSEFEAELQLAKKAEQEKIFRALRIAQKRAALNIEVSPLKATVLDSITVARPIGKSASTGEDLEFAGLDEHLALHLVEAAWAESAHDEVESLIARTAELLSYDSAYLVSAEKDLSKQAAVIPVISSEDCLNPSNEFSNRSAELRQAALNGNLILSSNATDVGESTDPKVSAIREALGQSRLGQRYKQILAS